MELQWAEGQVWIHTDFYEGPHDLLLTFAQRARIRWGDLSLEELLSAMLSILSSLPLEERIELLLFVSHLLRLKAFALLPARALTEELEETSSPESRPSTGPISLWERVSTEWEKLLQASQYRLPRPPADPSIPVATVITGLTQMRLFRNYEEVVRRYHRRHAVHRPTPLPFSPEEVENQLQQLLEEKSRLTLRRLWDQLLPHPIYRAMAFLLLLSWIQEGHVALTWHSPWDVELSWQR